MADSSWTESRVAAECPSLSNGHKSLGDGCGVLLHYPVAMPQHLKAWWHILFKYQHELCQGFLVKTGTAKTSFAKSYLQNIFEVWCGQQYTMQSIKHVNTFIKISF